MSMSVSIPDAIETFYLTKLVVAAVISDPSKQVFMYWIPTSNSFEFLNTPTYSFAMTYTEFVDNIELLHKLYVYVCNTCICAYIHTHAWRKYECLKISTFLGKISYWG